MSVSSRKSEVVKRLLMMSDRSFLRSFCLGGKSEGRRVKRSIGGKAAGPSLPSFLFTVFISQRAGGAESYEDVLSPFFRSHGLSTPGREEISSGLSASHLYSPKGRKNVPSDLDTIIACTASSL